MKKEDSFISSRTAGMVMFTAVVLFVFGSCWRMNEFITLDPDIFCRACGVLRFMAELSGQGLENWQSPALIPGHQSAPLIMYGPYTGMFSVYLATVFVLVLGTAVGTLTAFNLTQVFLGILTFFVVFSVVRRFFSLPVAGLCVFFMATNFSYVHAVRNGFVREELLHVFFLWLGLLLLLRSYERTRVFWFYLAMFVFGLALWAKIVFLGYIVCACVCMAVCFFAGYRGKIFFLPLRKLLPGLVFFALGAAPLIYFNCASSFETLKILTEAVTGSQKSFYAGQWVWDNWNVFSNLLVRARDMRAYLTGTITGITVENYFFPVLCLLGFARIMSVLFFGRRKNERIVLLLIVVFYSLLFVMSCFLLGFHYSGHVLMLFPVCEFVCAWAVADLSRYFPGRRSRYVFLCSVMCVWLVFQMRSVSGFCSKLDSEALKPAQIEILVRALESEEGEKTVLVASSCNIWGVKFFCPETRILIIPDCGMDMLPLFEELRRAKGKRFAFLVRSVASDRAFVGELEEYRFRIKRETILKNTGRDNDVVSLCELERPGG